MKKRINRYKEAVRWIAFNDETAELQIDSVAEQISVALVADIWGKERMKVAEDVMALRIDESGRA
jgi:hypothetical protein